MGLDIQALKSNPDIMRLNPELRGPPAGPVRSKYGNVPTLYRGRIYDSKKEAERAAYLDILVKSGDLAAVIPQVSFTLAGGIVYRCDFVVLHNDGTYRVEDVKGHRTKEYRIKKRLFKERYGREIIEV